MRKLSITISLAALALLIPAGSALAQVQPPEGGLIDPSTAKLSQEEKIQMIQEYQKAHPNLPVRLDDATTQRHSFANAQSPVTGFPQQTDTPAPRKAAPLKANANITLWGSVGYSRTAGRTGGYYSFGTTSPIDFTMLCNTENRAVANSGVQYIDDHLYSIWANLTYLQWDMQQISFYDYDTKTWTGTSRTLDKSRMDLVALETAQAADGTVYGEFYNAEATGLEWGVIDYETLTRTTIAPARRSYVALGITKAGQLYGVAIDGNLYKIDKETGRETVVGPTGISVRIPDMGSAYYNQTGEIDQRDDTFYWYAIPGNDGDGGFRGLYVVDLETGAASLIGETAPQVYGMVVPVPTADDNAPGKVTNASLTFDGASHNGTVAFTAPTTTYSGGELAGDLTYHIYDGTAEVKSGTVVAGGSVSTSLYIDDEGEHRFVITTSNSAGESPKVRIRKYVGYDTPLPTTGIRAVADSLDGNKVTVTWSPTAGGVHDGALNSAITYDVFRIVKADTVKVASAIADTTYTDNVPVAPYAYYVYGVQPTAGSHTGAIATGADGVALGTGIADDWSTTFATAYDFNLFNIIDANGDGVTWEHDLTYGKPFARSYYNSRNGNDDWFITPPFKFDKNYVYKLTFEARDFGRNTLEVKYGKGNTPAELTDTLMPSATIASNWTVYEYEIQPDDDADYRIAFHDDSPNPYPTTLFIAIDSISVIKSAAVAGPDSVTAVTLTPGDKGALTATVGFNIPTKTVGGADISKVDSIQIKRDGSYIETIGGGTAGSMLTYTDSNVPSNGVHEYELTAYTGNDFGRSTRVSGYIGQDTPGIPQNVSIADNTSDILAQWDAFPEIGPNGGYVSPDSVNVLFYSVVRNEWGAQPGEFVARSDKGATSLALPQDPEKSTTEGSTTQELYQLIAYANNNLGRNYNYVATNAIVVGPSISLPFKESLSGAAIDNGFAWTESNDQHAANSYAAQWAINPQASQDNDGGSFLWAPYEAESSWGWTMNYTIRSGDETSINMPKVSLRGATKPVLYYYINATQNDPVKLQVRIEKPDGSEVVADSLDLTANTTEGWTLRTLDLGSYASERYVIVKFRGIATGSNVSLGIDNVNIIDQLAYNLKATSISAPKRLRAGKTGTVGVTLINLGENAAKDYSVVLYADGQAADTVTVGSELQPFASDTVSLSLPVAINQSEPLGIKATIVYANDLDEEDNTTATDTIAIVASEYTKVGDLTADAASDGTVSLAWSKPVIAEAETTTEDFESYDAFSTDLGEWTTIDGDKGITGGYFQSYPYPGQGTAFAFDAFRPEAIVDPDVYDILANYPGFDTHSESQYAAAPYVTDASGRGLSADNWLISPQLSGKAQTVTFYVMNLKYRNTVYTETFDVLTSSAADPTDTTQFVKIASGAADGTTSMTEGANWKEISVDIPEGANYFAIHHNTDASTYYLFGIDDITFDKLPAGANDSIIGYNVYRDGTLVGSADGVLTAFTDGGAGEGSHVYNVTALYLSKSGDVNESGFSNDATVTVVNGIDEISANAEGTYDVFTIDGKTVMRNARSLKGLARGIYVINDRKYIIK